MDSRRAKIHALLFFVVLGLSACDRSNNVLLGRVEAKLGTHVVIVTDCYRTTVPPPQLLKADDGKPFFRFTPCRDADIMIQGEQLSVNGVFYETLKTGDTVIVDHGQVVVNSHVAQRTQQIP